LSPFGVVNFNFCRIYNDNSGVNLTTVPDFCEYYAVEELYKIGCSGKYNEYDDGYYFWDTLIGAKKVFSAFEQQCHTGHGIIVIKTAKEFCDQFYFSGSLNNPQIKNFFISCRDVIENFIAYFYEIASQLIAMAKSHRYFFPEKNECEELRRPNNYMDGGFILNSQQDLFKLAKHKNQANFTKRELQCIYYSSLGDSAKVVASHLKIAKKTVERHLENARGKIGARNKLELVRMVNELNDFNGLIKARL